MAAALPGDDGELVPVAELLDLLLERARPHARELGCADELEGLTALIEQGGGAGLQHAAHAEGEMPAVVELLTR